MDTSTAQTGLTIWNALLIAGIPGIIIAILGAYLNNRNSLKLLDKKLKTDLDLKKEGHLLKQRMQVWQTKFDVYKSLMNIFRKNADRAEGGTIKPELELLARDILFMSTESLGLFNNKAIGETLFEINNLLNKKLNGKSIDDFEAKMGNLTGRSLLFMKKELGIDLM